MDTENTSEGIGVKHFPSESQEEWIMQDMTLVLFGATGDLAQRKLFPALYNLFLDRKTPDSISIVALARYYCSN